MKETGMTTPAHCPICGADYIGGHALPGEEMEPGLRVFYACGCRICVVDGEVRVSNCGQSSSNP